MVDYKAHEISLPLSVKSFGLTTGTWTLTQSNSGIPKASKSAADETTTISIPIVIPRLSGEFGVRLKKILLPYKATTANFDAVPVTNLYKTNLYKATSGAAANVDATAVSVSNDGVVTASANDRLLTITVSAPDFDYATGVTHVNYNLDVVLDCAAGTVLTVYDAIAVYDDLR
jgi:hypothetical protein